MTKGSTVKQVLFFIGTLRIFQVHGGEKKYFLPLNLSVYVVPLGVSRRHV